MSGVVADASPLIALERIALGIHVAGVLGLLVLSKRRGLLPAVRPHIDTLLRTGFRADPDLVERILRRAGEAKA